MLKGNMIVLKGDKLSSGKDLVVSSTIKHFLRERENSRVIHVCCSQKRAEAIISSSNLEDLQKNRLAAISADEFLSSDSQQFIAPM